MSASGADRRFLAGIQNRLIIAFLTVTTVPMVVLAIYGAHSHLRALEELAFDAAADEARLRARKLQDALTAAQGDLFDLSQNASLDAYVRAAPEASEGEVGFLRDKLAKQFESFLATHGTYDSAAYMDTAGREHVRVRRMGERTPIVPFAELQSRPAHEELRVQTRYLLAGQVLPRIDPAANQPVLQFVTRLSPRGGQDWGFVVLELSLAGLLEGEELGESAARIVVFDQADRVIMGDAGELPSEWLRDLSQRPGEPAEIEDGQIATLVPIQPNRIDRSQKWSFVAIKPRSLVFASLTRYRWVFTGVLLLTLAGAAAVSVLFARQFTVPLKRLYAAAQEIGHGRFDVAIEDETGDEIGGLARELRAMADKLKIKHDDMQQQIDEKTRELLQAERLSTIGTMSAAIAHEVNNPLGVISLHCQMLLEQVGSDDPKAGKLRAIAREASRMSVLLRGLLQLSRKPDLNVGRVDLGGLITEAVSAITSLQEDPGRVELRTEMAEDCRVIEADADQLGQVLRNLIANAFHAISGRGSITITAESTEDDRVAVRVSDTGEGIDLETLERLFEPFFTTRPFGAGTGLGLSVSKDIIERHGGTVSVASRVGEGTTFTLLLPRRVPGAYRGANDKTTIAKDKK